MAKRLQLAPQLDVVVDLAVEDHCEATVGTPHRLVACGRQIEDREPAKAEADRACGVDALRIGPAVSERERHAPHDAWVSRAVQCENAYDAAHVLAPSVRLTGLPRMWNAPSGTP